jgi:hypothetical protein
MHNTNVVFRVGMFDYEIYFEQISVYFIWKVLWINFFWLTHFKLTYLGIMCASIGLTRIVMFLHIWCVIGRCRQLFSLAIKARKENFNLCLFNLKL